MDEIRARTFPHRKNPDGTWETICPDCLRTIARVKDQAELGTIESVHDCAQFERSGVRFGAFSTSGTNQADPLY
jgi:hypothetical protein